MSHRITLFELESLLAKAGNRKSSPLVYADDGGSRISGKRVHMYKGVGIRFADFIYSMKMK